MCCAPKSICFRYAGVEFIRSQAKRQDIYDSPCCNHSRAVRLHHREGLSEPTIAKLYLAVDKENGLATGAFVVDLSSCGRREYLVRSQPQDISWIVRRGANPTVSEDAESTKTTSKGSFEPFAYRTDSIRCRIFHSWFFGTQTMLLWTGPPARGRPRHTRRRPKLQQSGLADPVLRGDNRPCRR